MELVALEALLFLVLSHQQVVVVVVSIRRTLLLVVQVVVLALVLMELQFLKGQLEQLIKDFQAAMDGITVYRVLQLVVVEEVLVVLDLQQVAE
jgi:hypothetical protein